MLTMVTKDPPLSPWMLVFTAGVQKRGDFTPERNEKDKFLNAPLFLELMLK